MIQYYFSLAIFYGITPCCASAMPLYGTARPITYTPFCKNYNCIINEFSDSEKFGTSVHEIATAVNTRRKDEIFSKGNAVTLVIKYNAKGNLNDIVAYFPVGTLGRGLNGPELDYLAALIFTMTHEKIQPLKFSSDCVDWLDQTAGVYHVMHRGKLPSTGKGRAISYVIYCVGLGGPSAKVTDGVIKFGISEKFTPR